jgi:hypothetical protein
MTLGKRVIGRSKAKTEEVINFGRLKTDIIATIAILELGYRKLGK